MHKIQIADQIYDVAEEIMKIKEGSQTCFKY